MVSFFGFKIGGEKKKKSANQLDAAPPRPPKKDDRDASGKGQFLSREGGKPLPHGGGNVYSVSRPNTSHSYMITARPMKASPYSSSTAPIGATSMSDLRPPNHSNLKQFASNPSLGSNWLNASTPDLVPPVPMRNPTRPSTPVKQQPPNWISPLEMNSVRGPPPLVAAAPKSPMGPYELKLKIPSEQPTLDFEDDVSPKAPMPLRIRKPSPSPKPEPLSMGSQSPKKPPSPPQSVRASEESDRSPGLNRPIFPRDDIFRPSSKGSPRNGPTTLKEVLNTRDIPDYGPATLPSPISTPRGSEDEAPASSAAGLWDDDLDLFTAPVIQTVRARRDTPTSITSRRRSMEIKIEELEKPVMADALQRPKMSNGPQQPPHRSMRPPPLNLERRARTPDRAGTYPQPTLYSMDQRPSTPTGSRPPRDRAGPPPAAVGARGRPGRGVHRPNVDEYDFAPQPQPQSRRTSQDSSNYERPLSPDSPLLPVTGPLASPRFATLESQLAPPPRGGALFRGNRDPSPLRQEADSPTSTRSYELAAPRLGHRNVPTPDSSQWPLPSPTASSFDAASVSLSYSQRDDSPFRSAAGGGGEQAAAASRERYYGEPDSPGLPTPPRVIPVPPRADSPFGFRSFNFSRPMTPTSDLPLRHDPHPHPHHPPKRADTVPVSPMLRDPDISPSPGRPPPPRAATVNHHGGGVVGRGLRSPAIVGDDFGGGWL
ncbi:hypothetical protein GGR53DRAFT_505401 [Hypoxylon sp. FL1150]|nr:hypothetical protein GGR53DRAFT_505401 [Hypoxylon sp. FL1150]